MNETIPDILAGIRARLGAAQLIAVSKGQDAGKIAEALNADQRVFGENYVQEAREKWPSLRAQFTGIELHMIGPLQSNKAKEALELFDVIQTLDRDSLAKAIIKHPELARQKKFFIQVNIGEEAQKSGVMPNDADAFIRKCIGEYKLPIVGLMCIPPQDREPAAHFQRLARIAARHDLKQLSMGMSADWQTAIACGATHVRIGTAIFGERGR
ncbi:MAG: YggS family pyridoxal phosphate-dependent enzyme [Alphaproteobacteria bacterium]|nr:MAG: YggS family pyridoxal phosphate-dependent enzyme [Alphaproteobacteria bacterium]